MGRRLVILAVFLLAGAVVNVAVAWGCAMLPRPYHFSVADPGQDSVAKGFGRQVLSGPKHVGRMQRYERSVGWPMFMLREFRWEPNIMPLPRPDNVEAPDSTVTVRIAGVRFTPIWLGFAVNTLFYAAVLWLPVLGLHALRRAIRRTRGLCPKCAYPIGESSVCTECGSPVPHTRHLGIS